MKERIAPISQHTNLADSPSLQCIYHLLKPRMVQRGLPISTYMRYPLDTNSGATALYYTEHSGSHQCIVPHAGLRINNHIDYKTDPTLYCRQLIDVGWSTDTPSVDTSTEFGAYVYSVYAETVETPRPYCGSTHQGPDYRPYTRLENTSCRIGSAVMPWPSEDVNTCVRWLMGTTIEESYANFRAWYKGTHSEPNLGPWLSLLDLLPEGDYPDSRRQFYHISWLVQRVLGLEEEERLRRRVRLYASNHSKQE